MFNPRKLLTATAGLATVSYLGTTSCGGSVAEPKGTGGLHTSGDGDGESTGSGGGDGEGTGGYYTSGNLVPPGDYGSGGDVVTPEPEGTGGYYTSGNLVPPEYYDTGGANGSGGDEAGVGGEFSAGNLLPPQPD